MSETFEGGNQELVEESKNDIRGNARARKILQPKQNDLKLSLATRSDIIRKNVNDDASPPTALNEYWSEEPTALLNDKDPDELVNEVVAAPAARTLKAVTPE
jgi:hypothetical protein